MSNNAESSQMGAMRNQRKANGVDLTLVRTKSNHCSRVSSARRQTVNSDNQAIDLAAIATVETAATYNGFRERDVHLLLSQTTSRLPPRKAARRAAKGLYNFLRWDGLIGVIEKKIEKPKAERFIGLPHNQAKNLPSVWDTNPWAPDNGPYIDESWERKRGDPQEWQLIEHHKIMKKLQRERAAREASGPAIEPLEPVVKQATNKPRPTNMAKLTEEMEKRKAKQEKRAAHKRRLLAILKPATAFASALPKPWKPTRCSSHASAGLEMTDMAGKAAEQVQGEEYGSEHLQLPGILSAPSPLYSNSPANASTTGVKSRPASLFEREEEEERTGETTPTGEEWVGETAPEQEVEGGKGKETALSLLAPEA